MNLLLPLIFILLLPILSEEKKVNTQSKDLESSSPDNKPNTRSNKNKKPDIPNPESSNPSEKASKDSGKKSDKNKDKNKGKKPESSSPEPTKATEKPSKKPDKKPDKSSKKPNKETSKDDSKKEPSKEPNKETTKEPQKETSNKPDKKPNKGNNKKPGKGTTQKPAEKPDNKTTKTPTVETTKKTDTTKPEKPNKKEELDLWGTEIPYVIGSNLNENNIVEAFSRIEKHTCLKFTKLEKEDSTKSGLYFERSSTSYAWYGKAAVGIFQRIHLSEVTQQRIGSIQFLIAITLGFFPEILRNDRDDYVKILSDKFNMYKSQSYTKQDLKMFPINDIGYDYGSLLQYSAKYLSKDGSMTIEPKIKQYSFMMGQRKGFSFNNYKFINYRYCKKVCKDQKKCKNSGYLNPKKCSECKCPNGYEGNFCEKVVSSPKSCKTVSLKATSKKSELKGSGNNNCTYTIKASDKKVVELTIESVETEKVIPCLQRKGLEIKYRKDRGAMGLNLCGSFQNISLTSETQEVLVQFIGKSSANNFKITYSEKKK